MSFGGGGGGAEAALPADRIVYQQRSKWDAQPRKPLFSEWHGELNRARDKGRGLERWCRRQSQAFLTEGEAVSRSVPELCPCPWAVRSARRRRLWGRRAPRLLSRLRTASVEPQTQLIASQRPLGAVPAANVPHFPLLRPCRASCSGALAQRIPRSAPPAAPPGPTGTAPRPRTHTALTVRTRKPSLSLQIPSRTGEPSVRAGRHGRGNPSSTDALFIRRFSIPGVGRGGGSPVLPLPELGRHRSSLFPPILTLTFCVGIFTWRTAASLLRTKPRELYSDTRELLAREEAHAGRLPAAGDKKAAGWSLRHRERWMRCSFLGRKRDWSLRPGWFAAESVWSEPKKTSTRTSAHRHTHKDVSSLPLHSAFSPLPLYPRYLSTNYISHTLTCPLFNLPEQAEGLHCK